MEVIRFSSASASCPFPFAAALMAAVESGGGGWLECFVLVENTRPFLGFRRRPLEPGAGEGVVVEEMQAEAARILEQMVRAAGLDPVSRAPAGPALVLADKAEDCLRNIRGRGFFAAHLRWIAQKSGSHRLRAQIVDSLEKRGVSGAPGRASEPRSGGGK